MNSRFPFLIAAAFTLAAAPCFAEAAAKKTPAIDPQAIGHLQRMSASLASAKAFRYKSTNTLEVPASTGQFVTVFSTVDVAVKRPDKLRVRLTGEAPHFDFHYDGSSVTAYAPGPNAYSYSKAPATLDEMLPELEQQTSIRFATMPLLFSDPYKVLTRGVTSAFVAGSGKVRGVPCVHLALKSPGVNWEIWIESGARALPMRLATTFTDRPNFPRTMVEFSSWNLHPWLMDRSFSFSPPKEAREISFDSILKSSGR